MTNETKESLVDVIETAANKIRKLEEMVTEYKTQLGVAKVCLRHVKDRQCEDCYKECKVIFDIVDKVL